MRDVISEFNFEIEGSLAFCALILFMCSILCSGSSSHPAHWDVVFVFMENDVCVTGVCSVYVWWWLNVRENSICVYSKLCPVCFPIVRGCVSVLL